MVRARCNLFLLMAGVLALAMPTIAAPTSAPDGTTAQLQTAVNGSWRSPAHKARDQYRHPIETLQFFGIKPDMSVIELQPGAGWYTEIIAPFLYASGHLFEASGPKINAIIKANPAVFGHIGIVIPFAPPKQIQLGADNSVDMVVSFRNTHDWLNDNPDTLAAVFQSVFHVLRHGGVFGLEEHRAKPFADAAQSSKDLHRISEDYLIALALKTGFQLDGISEVNANPRDPEDINVHRLPPDLAGADAEHEAMKAIGESDRMTLRFVKP